MPETHSAEGQRLGVEAALAAWRRRRWLALAVFVLAWAGSTAAILALPPLYRARATVLVERQQISEAFVRSSVTTELETRIQTIHRQVTSRARLSDVITRFNLYPELTADAPIEAVVEHMRRDIQFDVSGVPQMSGRTATIAFTVGYLGRDPFMVAEVTNTLVNSYVDEHTKARERQAVRTASFLKTQLDEARRELDGFEQREREFTLQHTSELPQQVTANLAALDRLNTQLRLNGEYQLRAVERRERVEREIATQPKTGRAAPEASGTAAELERLKQQLAALTGKFSDRYPDVARLRREIAALEGQSAAANGSSNGHGTPATDGAERAPQHMVAQIDAELAGLKQEEALLRRLIAGHEGRIENAPKRQDELQQLTRDSETSKERYETLLKRYEEAKVAETLEQEHDVEGFRVLDPAVAPRGPAVPNRLWLLVLSFVGSLALALASVVAREKLDTTFHSVDELRAFAAVPTVAVIRRIPTPAGSTRTRRRAALAALAIVAALAAAIGAGRYIGSGNEQIVRMTERGRS
jgi:polysaccharide chain length determinant protein (PEP-CTERM system associated)